MITHHLNDTLLMAYSSGNLPEAFALVVASHISLCDECRARLESFDAVGGSLMEAAPSEPVAIDSFAAVMSRIGQSKAMPIPAPARKSAYPAPLREYLPKDEAAIRWRSVGMGVRQAVLTNSKEASVRLLRIPAGCAVPDHGHHGMELTLVLKGAFRDEIDRFGPGDIEIADQDTHHTPVAEEGEDCICLTATDAPLKFNSWLPKIAQPFLGI
ncbi:MAG: ChrR family anti-sigma-E factor [Pseudomonadota bacterium]